MPKLVPHQVPVPVSYGGRSLTSIAFTCYQSLMVNCLQSASPYDCGGGRGVFFSLFRSSIGARESFSPSCCLMADVSFIYFFSNSKTTVFSFLCLCLLFPFEFLCMFTSFSITHFRVLLDVLS